MAASSSAVADLRLERLVTPTRPSLCSSLKQAPSLTTAHSTVALVFSQCFRANLLLPGVMMSGTITVVPVNEPVASPADVAIAGANQIAADVAKVSLAAQQVADSVPAPTANLDGTTTCYVAAGGMVGNVDLLAFFPNTLYINPGDSVTFFNPSHESPHQVGFYNGMQDPPLRPVNVG
jgi:plastocyanin